VVFLLEKTMTKEEVIAAMNDCAVRMGRIPSFPELQAATGITNRMMRRCFGNYSRMLESCGLERQGAGFRIGMKALFVEWAGLVRKLKKIPTLMEYEVHSQYSVRPLMSRFGGWKRVPVALYHYARKEGLDVEWKDVLDVIAAQATPMTEQDMTTMTPTLPHGEAGVLITRPAGIFTDRPVYGPPLRLSPLTCAPTNETGVVFLFGSLACKLGFSVIRLQNAFPDGEALREMEPGRWQRVRIEFEYESRNFLLHMHDAAECDLIVCWRHNWEDCPLEVLELGKMIDKIG
jgi:hypothetical protein